MSEPSSNSQNTNATEKEDNLSPTESTKKFYNDHVEDYIANISKAGVTHAPTQHAVTFHRYLQETFSDDNGNDNDNNQEEKRRLFFYKVLELGCGYGRDAEFFLQTNEINIIATDYSRSMLLKAQERLEQACNNNNNATGSVHCLEMDMRDIAHHFLPNSLHGIWACATLIHIPKKDIPALLQNMYTVLKPGGMVYVSVKVNQPPPHDNSNTENGETFDPDYRYGGIRKFYAFYQVDEFRQYFLDQHFTIDESGVSDHRNQDSYATHPFVHVFARKPRPSA